MGRSWKQEKRTWVFMTILLMAMVLLLPQKAEASLDLSEEAVYQAIMSKKTEYYEGRPWNANNYYQWNGGYYIDGTGCAALVFALSDAAFGTLPARRLVDDSFDSIRVGDILRVDNDSHFVIVVQKFENYVSIAEGDYAGTVHWGRQITKAQLENPDRTKDESLTYIFTRYPTDPDVHHFELVTREGSSATLRCTDCNKTKTIALPENVKTGFKKFQDKTFDIKTSLCMQVGDSYQYLLAGSSGYSDAAVETEISNGDVLLFANETTKAKGRAGAIEAKGNGIAVITVRSIYEDNKVIANFLVMVGDVPPLEGSVKISGEPKSGRTLTANIMNCNYPEEILTVYWGKQGYNYDIGMGPTYRLTDDDIGNKIFCVVTKGELSDPDCLYSAYTATIQEASPVRLEITNKSLTLVDAVAIDFMISEEMLQDFHDPYIAVTQNGLTRNLTSYRVVNGNYVFTYRVAPQMMGDLVTAVPHALDADGEDVTGETFEYSVAQYCYNMLGKANYQTEEWAPFRKLLVDILLYGDAAQQYQNYRTDALVGAQLSQEQRAMGTDVTAAMTYHSVKNKEFETVSTEDAVTYIDRAMLYLVGAVNIRFGFKVDDPTGLRVVVTGNPDGSDFLGEYVPNEEQKDQDGYYYISMGRLNAGQMRKTVYATVMKGDKKVSNTYRYSIESYVASMKSDNNTTLDKLLDAMMRYGDAAAAYRGNK